MQLPSTYYPGQDSESPLWHYLKEGMQVFTEIASEPLAFAVASLAIRSFIPPFAAPLAGIAAGLLSTKLVIKVLTPYNCVTLMDMGYEASQLRERYPKLQTISSLFALSISCLSSTLGIVSGIAIGIYGAFILDIENYKFMQKADRKALLEKG